MWFFYFYENKQCVNNRLFMGDKLFTLNCKFVSK